MMTDKNKTMKATGLIKKLVELIGQNGDADVIIDYDCRRITGVHHDTADLEYDYYGWMEIETEEEENHRKFYETLGWRKCSDDMLNQKLNIRTTESVNKFLVVDGYEISIDTLLKLPKEN